MRLNSWLLLFQTSGPINNFLVGTGVVKEPITFIYTDGLVLIGLIKMCIRDRMKAVKGVKCGFDKKTSRITTVLSPDVYKRQVWGPGNMLF